MKHRYLDEAVADFENAVVYNEIEEPGLGARFIVAFDELLATVLEFPRLGARVTETPKQLEVRRCVVQTFGVEIVYQLLSESKLVIVAIFHGSREPGFWVDRLESS